MASTNIPMRENQSVDQIRKMITKCDSEIKVKEGKLDQIYKKKRLIFEEKFHTCSTSTPNSKREARYEMSDRRLEEERLTISRKKQELVDQLEQLMKSLEQTHVRCHSDTPIEMTITEEKCPVCLVNFEIKSIAYACQQGSHPVCTTCKIQIEDVNKFKCPMCRDEAPPVKVKVTR